MRSLSRLLRPVRGSICFEGEAIESLPTDAIVARGIVLVPEGRRVFSPLSVRETLELGGYKLLRARRHTAFRRGMDYVLDLFPRLAERSNQSAGTLSVGAQQMVALRRDIIIRPSLILFVYTSMGLRPSSGY